MINFNSTRSLTKIGCFRCMAIVFLLLGMNMQAQIKDTIYNFENLSKESHFKGGGKKMITYIKSNLSDQYVTGKVYVQFIVEPDGSISNARVLKGLDEETNKKVLKIINDMPAWVPGEVEGKKVRSYFNLPISFNSN